MAECALQCAQKIIDDKAGVGLPGGQAEWMARIQETIDMGPHFKVDADYWPAVCPRICLCISSFKRTWQLEQCLPINCVMAWPWREKVQIVSTSVSQSRSAPFLVVVAGW